MSGLTPMLAARGSAGLSLITGPPTYEAVASFPNVATKNLKVMQFSDDGRYFTWFDGVKIMLVAVPSWKSILELERPKTMCLHFSPKGTYLAAWEPFVTNKDNPNGSPNLHIWKTVDGTLVYECVQKKQIKWQPQWSKDEVIFAINLDGQVTIYDNGNFQDVKYRIKNVKVACFSLSPTSSPYYVTCYVPGGNGPSFGRLFCYPNFEVENCIASKTFFKVDKVDIYWNSEGTYVLLLTSTEVDKTGSSYYGKQGLHFLSTKGDTAIVLLDKEGPIHDVCWSPIGEEFCVIYGFMPSKTALFNKNCEVIFDFGSGHRNSIYYNPHGNIVLLGGFGNISGTAEVWDATNRRKICKLDARDTTLLHWSPEGTHFLTATTAPRLRVSNGFKIWHYSGSLIYERPWNQQEELWEVIWQTFPKGTFKKPTISFKHVEGIQPTEPKAKEVYRPPGARGQPSVKAFNLHDESDFPETKKISKVALKMKKKRETKRQAKLQQQKDCPENPQPASNGNVESEKTNRDDKVSRIKKVKMSLKAIDKLKELQATGKELDANQLCKVNKEADLLNELKALTV